MQFFLTLISCLGHHQNWFIRILIVFALKIAALLLCAIAFYEVYIFNLCRRYFANIKDIDLALDKEETHGLKIQGDN